MVVVVIVAVVEVVVDLSITDSKAFGYVVSIEVSVAGGFAILICV